MYRTTVPLLLVALTIIVSTGVFAQNCCIQLSPGILNPPDHEWQFNPANPNEANLMMHVKAYLPKTCSGYVDISGVRLVADGTGNDAADINWVRVDIDIGCDGKSDGTVGQSAGGYPVDNGTMDICHPTNYYRLTPDNSVCFLISYNLKNTAPCGKTYHFTLTGLMSPGCRLITSPPLCAPFGSAKKTVVDCLRVDLGPESPRDHFYICSSEANNPLNLMQQIRICNPCGTPKAINGLTLQAGGSGNDLTGIQYVVVKLDSDCDGMPDAGVPQLMGGYNADNGTLTLCSTSAPLATLSAQQCICLLIYYQMKCSAPVGTYYFDVTDIRSSNCQLTCATGLRLRSAVKSRIRFRLNVINAGGGLVTSNIGGINCPTVCSAEFDYDPDNPTTVNLTAAPSSGAKFCCWEDGSGATTRSVVMDSDKTVTATFTYPLTVTKAGSGSGTVTSDVPGINCGPVCTADYPYGTAVTLSATPDSNSEFAGWSGACSGTGNCPITMTAPRSVTAYFTDCCLRIIQGPASPRNHIYECLDPSNNPENFMCQVKIENPCGETKAIHGLRIKAGGTGDWRRGVATVRIKPDTDCDGNPDGPGILASYNAADGTLDICDPNSAILALAVGQSACLNIYYQMNCDAPEGVYYFDVLEILGPNCEPVCSSGLPITSAEKTVVSRPEPADYGDAPDPTYPTLSASNGARHAMGNMWLGNYIDVEPDGQPDPSAAGDDLNGLADEDGVEFLTLPLTPGDIEWVNVTATGPDAGMFLCAWIDFNSDGSWATPGDHIFMSKPLVPGPNVINFVVPATATPGVETFARFRLHANPGGIGFTGAQPTGEVEDYPVSIEGAGKADLGDAPDSTNSYKALMTAYPAGGPPGVIAKYPTVYDAGSPPYGPIHLDPRSIAFLGDGVTLENEADQGADEDGVNNIIPPNDLPDLDGADDGVVFPMILPSCAPASFQYFVTVVTPGIELYVNAWFDWSRDGDWDDVLQCREGIAPEWAVQNQRLIFEKPGTYPVSSPEFLPWHLTDGEISPLWMRITLSERPWEPSSQLGGEGGSGPPDGYRFGETEDYYFIPEFETRDWGDAPDPTYPTLAASNGASHIVVPGMHLGASVDTEADGQPNAAATGDDGDEDGVAFLGPFIPGLTTQFEVTASVAGKLDVWFDRDGNGSWDVPGDQMFTSYPIEAGVTRLGIAVTGPGGFFTCLRFRFSSTGGLAPTGPATDGEVEDYRVWVYPQGAEVTKGEAKNLPVGTLVLLKDNIVTANFGSDGWYFEEPDLSSGIGVMRMDGSVAQWSPGDRVSCYGETILNGCELMLAEIYSALGCRGCDPLAPLGQNNRDSGGGPFGNQPGLMDVVGFLPKPSVALNSVGMLVTLWGRCTCILTDPEGVQTDFWIDDGSGLWDSLCESNGVKVHIPPGYAGPPIELRQYYSVAGIMRTDTTPLGECLRWLWTRTPEDITAYGTPQ